MHGEAEGVGTYVPLEVGEGTYIPSGVGDGGRGGGGGGLYCLSTTSKTS